MSSSSVLRRVIAWSRNADTFHASEAHTAEREAARILAAGGAIEDGRVVAPSGAALQPVCSFADFGFKRPRPLVVALPCADAHAFAAATDGVGDVMEDATVVNRVQSALLDLAGVARDLVGEAIHLWALQEEGEADNTTGVVGLFRH